MKRKTGFTLLELMVVALIVVIIMAAVYAVSTVGRQSWQTGKTRIELQQELRLAMDWMSRELRESGINYAPKYADSISLPGTGAAFNTVTFRTSNGWDNVNSRIDWGDPVTYTLGGPAGDQILRSVTTGMGVTTTILANKITSLQFRRSADVVQISLQAQKTALPGRLIQLSLDSQISLRN